MHYGLWSQFKIDIDDTWWIQAHKFLFHQSIHTQMITKIKYVTSGKIMIKIF